MAGAKSFWTPLIRKSAASNARAAAATAGWTLEDDVVMDDSRNE
jgi:hypothetical protein